MTWQTVVSFGPIVGTLCWLGLCIMAWRERQHLKEQIEAYRTASMLLNIQPESVKNNASYTFNLAASDTAQLRFENGRINIRTSAATRLDVDVWL